MVNRGVAIWEGKVFVGAIDGRLIAIDAANGEEIWSVQTTDPERHYTITGAPRIGKGKVVIGNGGAEFGVRGYVTAYDADTGDQAWRFWIVPGDPSQPFEHPEMEVAAATWTGEWWKIGGGGTAWDGMAYDSDLELMYIGTGNGAPWTRMHRSPGGGDNLYLSSILAIDINTGKLTWHYQTTPSDNWDYTAVQRSPSPTSRSQARRGKVIMQAPKNGFFYVLDRATGELISAEPYVKQTWATHVDMETGRPVEVAGGDYEGTPRSSCRDPSAATTAAPGLQPRHRAGLHSSAGCSFIYPKDHEFEYEERRLNLGLDLPEFARLALTLEQPVPVGYLRAWDPVKSEIVWDVEMAGVFNGGVLSMAGNLVFQGTSEGEFAAYAADSGDKLWSEQLNVGMIAAPIAYSVDGEQYVAILAGFGGAVNFGVDVAITAAYSFENVGRLFVYKLGGSAEAPSVRQRDLAIPNSRP